MPRVVQRSKSLARILALPRRTWESEADAEACRLLTDHFKRPAGTMALYPVQCAGLAELADHGGAFLQAGVGQGKTLISALATNAAEASRPLLFIPAKLKGKTVREFRALNEHWHVHPIRIESYEQLSRAESGRVLLGEREKKCEKCKTAWPVIVLPGHAPRDAPACGRCQHKKWIWVWVGYLPDLLDLDEAHKAKNPKAACTRKIKRYIKERRADGYLVMVVVMSGTLAKRSIKDFAHLAAWTDPLYGLNIDKMRENVAAGLVPPTHLDRVLEWRARYPLPEHDHELMIWADAVDEGVTDTKRAEPGALLLMGGDGPDELTQARRGLQRRIFDTPGYIATSSNDVADCSLVIECHQVEVPDEVDVCFDKIKHWETPCGLPIDTGIELWRHCREVQCDFYYRPKVTPPIPWMKARREWSSRIRKRLQYNHMGLDSPAMVEADVIRLGDHGCKGRDRNGDPHTLEGECKPCKLWDAYVAWDAIRGTFELDTDPVWIGETCLNWVEKWAEDGPGLIWVEHPIVGQRIAKRLGVEYYGRQGLNSRKQCIDAPGVELGDRCAVASLKANSEGRNLQKIWSRALVTSMPTTGLDAEQMIGRLHRPGQLADEVKIDIMIACREQLRGLVQALRDANFHSDLLGNQMKINGGKSADIIVPTWKETGWAWKEPIRV